MWRLQNITLSNMDKAEQYLPWYLSWPVSIKNTSMELSTKQNAYLEDFRISHQFFNRVIRVKSVATKYLQMNNKKSWMYPLLLHAGI